MCTPDVEKREKVGNENVAKELEAGKQQGGEEKKSSGSHIEELECRERE